MPHGPKFDLHREKSLDAAQREDRLVALLSRSALGDEAAFALLYDATSRRLYGLTIRILRDPSAAEEAALAAYASVWDRASSYDPRLGTPMAWMLTIARSKAIDLLRSRTRRNRGQCGLESVLDLQSPTPSPEAASSQAERSGRVRAALSSLPPAQRKAIETVYFEGLSHTEVAATLGVHLGTVKSRIRLGLSSLRRALSEDG